ncbi:MAG: toll/interleukin-1 receptor domain-containing protein [Chloroflexi bacterium]|nr:toll/interleukin-1 receptor domain-containing protein [Chloroflexota bacterium]
MADVFISYAREDKDFLGHLCDALAEFNLDTWVDSEDIIPSDKWWEAVQAGIAGSDNFVFVISPYSAHSEACFNEAAYADQIHKRMLPVVYCNIDDDADLPHLHATLRERHWIFMRGEDDFNEAFQKLIDAINTDLPYIKKHTEYFRAAQAWKGGSGPLLSGKRLRVAEDWVVQSSDKEPTLASEHHEYFNASRRAQQRTLRILIASAFAAGIVFLILAILAFWQSRVAEANAAEARRQAIETNNQLQTNILINNTIAQPVGPNPEQPLLLGADLWVVNSSGQIWQLRADTGQPRAAPVEVGSELYRPVYDGKYLWVGSTTRDKLVRLDPRDIQSAEIVDLDAPPLASQPIATNGTWVWALTGSRLIPVNRETLEIGEPVEVGRDPKYPLFDGTYIWTVDARELNLYRVHAETGETDALSLGGSPQQPVFAARQLWIAESENGQLFQIDPVSLSIIQTMKIGTRLHLLTQAGDWLWGAGAGANGQNEIIQIDLSNGTIRQRIPVSQPVRALCVHDDTLWVYENGQDVYTLDLDTYERKFTVANVNAHRLSEPVFTPDYTWIADRAGNRIYAITSEGEIVRQLPVCAGPTAPIFDGTMLWAGCRDDQTVARIPALLDYHGQSSGIDQIGENYRPYAPLLLDQKLWIVQEADGKVIVYDTRPQDIRPETRAFEVGVYPSHLVPDLPWLWLTHDDPDQGIGLYRFDSRQVDEPRIYHLGSSWPDAVKLVNEKVWLLTTTDTANPTDDDLLLVDPATGSVQERIDLGVYITGLVEDGGRVWANVINISGGSLCQLDIDTGASLGCTQLEHLPAREPAIIGDSIWVSGAIPGRLFEGVYQSLFSAEDSEAELHITGALYEFRRSDGQFIRQIDLDYSPWLPVPAGPYLWFTAADRTPTLNTGYNPLNQSRLVALNPETGEVVETWNPCPHMLPPFYAGELLYAACIGTPDYPGDLLVIDPETLIEVHRYSDLGRGAWPLVHLGDWVWAVYRDSGNVALLRPETGELEHLYGLGQAPTPPVYDSQRYVWIANTVDATVQRILMPE